MNIHYKIDKDTIVVTDQNGKMRMIPKYTQAEQVLTLENDIEAIDQAIDDKEKTIQANQKKTLYKCFKPIMIGLSILMCIAVLSAFALLVSVALNFVTEQISTFILLLPMICIALGLPLEILSSFGTVLNNENQVLSEEINCLREIRYQKVKQLEELKKDINNSLKPQEEKTVPNKKNMQELYKEAYHIIMDEMTKEMDCEEYKASISQILDSLKEVEQSKQKILNRN